MRHADSSDTSHPRSDEVRGRERHQGGYGEAGGFGDRGYGDRGDLGDQGQGSAAHREADPDQAVPDDGTPEHDAPPED